MVMLGQQKVSLLLWRGQGLAFIRNLMRYLYQGVTFSQFGPSPPSLPLPTHSFFVKASGPEELFIYTIIISDHPETNKNAISVLLFLSFTLLMAMLNPYVKNNVGHLISIICTCISKVSLFTTRKSVVSN